MFCSKCGNNMDDNSKFCPVCGTPTGLDMNADAPTQAPVTEQAPVMEAPVNAQAPQPTDQPMMAGATGAPMMAGAPVMAAPKVKKPRPKWLIPAIAGGVALIAIIIAVIVIIKIQPKKVNLTKYITADFSGYNGRGKAYFELDYDKLVADGYIPEMNELSFSAMQKYINLEAAYNSIELTPDKTTDLSNGDEIIVTITYDNNLAKKNKQKFTGKTAKFTVEGLSDIAVVDPFEGLTVSFNGVNGSGYLSLEYDNRLTEVSVYSFSYDKYSELSNGDTVTLTLNYDEDYTAQYYGRTYSVSTKSFTVSGLASYMDSISDLSESDYASLTTAAKDSILQYIEDNYDSCNTVDNLKEVGTASLRNNDPDSWRDQQYTYFIYSGTITCSENEFAPTQVFYPVCISNILLYDGVFQGSNEPYIQDSCYIQGTWTSTKGCIDLYQFLHAYCENEEYTVTCSESIEEMMNREKIITASQFSDSSFENLQDVALWKIQKKDDETDSYDYTDITYVGNSLGNRIEIEDCSVSNEHKIYLYFTAVASNSEYEKPIYISVEFCGVNILPDGTIYYTDSKLNGWTSYWEWTSGIGYDNVEYMFDQTVGYDLDYYNFEYNNDLVPESYLTSEDEEPEDEVA